MASRLFHESKVHAQTQTAALPHVLRHEKGFEDTLPHVVRHAHPVVGDRQYDVIAGNNIGCA